MALIMGSWHGAGWAVTMPIILPVHLGGWNPGVLFCQKIVLQEHRQLNCTSGAGGAQ